LKLKLLPYQDLRLSSVSIRHEIQNCQRRWSEELNGLGMLQCSMLFCFTLHTLTVIAFYNLHIYINSAGQSLNILINDSENYHAALEENRKLYNEIQELKGNSSNREHFI
jgi:kinesin family member C2/C3